jgi:hypothetical protein
LRDRQEKHRYGQHGGVGHTRDHEAESANKSLGKCGHHDAQRNTANRLAREPDGVFPSCPSETLPEAHHAQGHKLTLGIHNRGENDG